MAMIMMACGGMACVRTFDAFHLELDDPGGDGERAAVALGWRKRQRVTHRQRERPTVLDVSMVRPVCGFDCQKSKTKLARHCMVSHGMASRGMALANLLQAKVFQELENIRGRAIHFVQCLELPQATLHLVHKVCRQFFSLLFFVACMSSTTRGLSPT